MSDAEGTSEQERIAFLEAELAFALEALIDWSWHVSIGADVGRDLQADLARVRKAVRP